MRTPAPLPRFPDPRMQTWADLLEADPPIKSVAAAYTATALDATLIADATSAAFTVTLPAVASCKGKVLTVKKVDAGANAVTVDGNGSEEIEGSATVSLSAQWDSVTVQSTGSAWIILGST